MKPEITEHDGLWWVTATILNAPHTMCAGTKEDAERMASFYENGGGAEKNHALQLCLF